MATTHVSRWSIVALWLLATCAAPALAADRPPATRPAKADAALDNEPAQWTRFSEDAKGNGKLEVGIGTYKNDAGVTVHLVGAVHIGDKKYYSDLDKLFDGYDALLYEMVKPADAGAPGKARKVGGGMVSMLQRFMKDTLELEYQLDGIDYTKKNFVHADLDVETFEKLQAERGESLLGLMVQQMMRDIAKQLEGKGNKANQPGLLDILAILDAPDRAKQLKLMMGRSLGEMEEQVAGFQGTVLVTERNKKAIEVLRSTIRDGKKNIGVFYGAAHMPDLESRLALMGFKRTGFEFKTAWDIKDEK